MLLASVPDADSTSVWKIGPPSNPEMVSKICAGETVHSVRSLLKYYIPAGVFEPEDNYATRSIYEHGYDKRLFTYEVVLKAFLAIRGSTNSMLCLRSGYVSLTASGILDETAHTHLSGNWERHDAVDNSTLVVNHPYSTPAGFVITRTDDWHVQYASHPVYTILMSTSERVDRYASVGEDFSASHYLGIPLIKYSS
jgi:hypothetical protein